MHTLITSISAPEIKKAAEEAALLAESSCLETSKRGKLTFVSLARFGASFSQDTMQVEARQRHPLTDKDDYEGSLKEALYSTGLFYFGPMFRPEADDFTPLRPRGQMIKEFHRQGFLVECLDYLTHEQLDMFFTRLLETGLLTYRL